MHLHVKIMNWEIVLFTAPVADAYDFLITYIIFFILSLWFCIHEHLTNSINLKINVIIVTEECAKFSVCESEIQVKMT